MILPIATILVGLILLVPLGDGDLPLPRLLGGIMVAGGVVLAIVLAWQGLRPRLAHRDGSLRVYLRAGAPYQVPIEIVEGFLLGRAPALLPGKSHRTAETAALVIRLAQSAEDWSRRETHPALGKWCEGYITIRGTWCEPLSVEFVNGLNARLAKVARLAAARPADPS